jgi:leucyl/phenylalanyl-tRNA---protein transferase
MLQLLKKSVRRKLTLNMVFQLDPASISFPDPNLADPSGILAFGGDLSVKRLILAYSHGIFPWYNEGEPIIWWCTAPRLVLYPDELKVAKSMRSAFNQNKFSVTYNTVFEQVMRGCQYTIRENQEEQGTWITQDIIDAYTRLHLLGYAHSVEVWQDNILVGGLYGIALGKCFFGESMFANASNASKFGFITLVRHLHTLGFTLIDCQQETNHLASLGAKPISKEVFLQHLQDNRLQYGNAKTVIE